MAVSAAYRAFVIEQLERVRPVAARAMFGGVSLYADERIFALIDNDTLYFKVDDSNRPDYEAAGMGAFHPYNDSYAMNYYEVPPDLLEDPDALAPWVAKAVAVSGRKPQRKKR